MPEHLRSPDHSTCSSCGEPISWDEICYVHDDTGFADCGIKFGKAEYETERFVINPEIQQKEEFRGKFARPVEWGSPEEAANE